MEWQHTYTPYIILRNTFVIRFFSGSTMNDSSITANAPVAKYFRTPASDMKKSHLGHYYGGHNINIHKQLHTAASELLYSRCSKYSVYN